MIAKAIAAKVMKQTRNNMRFICLIMNLSINKKST